MIYEYRNLLVCFQFSAFYYHLRQLLKFKASTKATDDNKTSEKKNTERTWKLLENYNHNINATIKWMYDILIISSGKLQEFFSHSFCA